MDGVIIHAEHVYRESSLEIVIFLAILLIAMIAIFFLAALKAFQKKSKDKWFFFTMVIVSTVFSGVFFPMAVTDYQTIHKDYVVTVDDSVGFNEFNNTYEIISQDGSLYTVRLLEQQEAKETEPVEE